MLLLKNYIYLCLKYIILNEASPLYIYMFGIKINMYKILFAIFNQVARYVVSSNLLRFE